MKNIKSIAKIEMKYFRSYVLFGGCGVLVDYMTYYYFLKNNFEYNLANVFGYLLGTLVSFLLNRHYTFKLRDRIFKRLLFFFTVAGVGLLISIFLLWLFVEVASVTPVIAKIIVIPLIVIFQFLLNKRFSFALSV